MILSCYLNAVAVVNPAVSPGIIPILRDDFSRFIADPRYVSRRIVLVKIVISVVDDKSRYLFPYIQITIIIRLIAGFYFLAEYYLQ